MVRKIMSRCCNSPRDCCNIVVVHVRVMVLHGISSCRCYNSSNGCMSVVHMCHCQYSNRRGYNYNSPG